MPVRRDRGSLVAWSACVLVVSASSAGCSGGCHGPPSPSGQGNFLVVVADDVGVDRVSGYGAAEDAPSTPTLDGLMARGVSFRKAWAEPECSPSRAALLTGRAPHQTGIGTALSDHGRVYLRPEEVTIAELLGDRYTSAFVGKWHLASRAMGEGYLRAPQDQGFDRFEGTLGSPESYWRWTEVTDGVEHTVDAYSTTVLTDQAIDAVGRLPEPFLLVVSYGAAHGPWERTDPSLTSGQRVGSTPMQTREGQIVEAMDREVGRLLAAMDPGVLARTTVIYTSDNGTPWNVHAASFGKMGKGSAFEGGVRVPLVVAGPTVTRHGEWSDHLVQLTDLFATLAELAGVPVPDDGVERDTISFAPALRDASAPEARTLALTEVLHGDPFDLTDDRVAARDDRYKLVVHEGREVLFDLGDAWVETPEQVRHAQDGPEVAAALDRLHQVLAERR